MVSRARLNWIRSESRTKLFSSQLTATGPRDGFSVDIPEYTVGVLGSPSDFRAKVNV